MKSTKKKNNKTSLSKKRLILRQFFNDILPICVDYNNNKEEFIINIATQDKAQILSPTGKNWGYYPLEVRYSSYKEADKIRRELYKFLKTYFSNTI